MRRHALHRPAVFIIAAVVILSGLRCQSAGGAATAFNRHPHRLVYTHHALCRMDCRHITREDITGIMEQGTIFLRKTNLDDKPCPTFALQGFTTDHQDIRVIFAQCDVVTKVITCYNLEKEYECHCPGDEGGPSR